MKPMFDDTHRLHVIPLNKFNIIFIVLVSYTVARKNINDKK